MGLFNFMKKRDNSNDTTTPQTTPEISDVLLQALINESFISINQAK